MIIPEAAGTVKGIMFRNGAVLYARVSTNKQNPEPQRRELRQFLIQACELGGYGLPSTQPPDLNHALTCAAPFQRPHVRQFTENRSGRDLYRQGLQYALAYAAKYQLPLLATDRTRIIRGRNHDRTFASDVPNPSDLQTLETHKARIVTLAGWEADPAKMRSQQTLRTGRAGRPRKAGSVRQDRRAKAKRREQRRSSILAMNREGYGAADISNRLNIPRRTVYNVLASQA